MLVIVGAMRTPEDRELLHKEAQRYKAHPADRVSVGYARVVLVLPSAADCSVAQADLALARLLGTAVSPLL